MSMEWGSDLVINFIQAYKSEPVIWDTSNRYHKDRRKLIDAWERIGKRLNIEVVDLKRKKESLLASYRIHAKRKKASLAAGEELYRPIWFAYEALEEFLNPELARYKSGSDGGRDAAVVEEVDEVSNQEDSDHTEYLEDNDAEDDTYNNSSEILIKQELTQPVKRIFTNHHPKPRLTMKRPIKKRIIKTSDNSASISELRILEALKSLKKTETLKRKRDECDTFGEYIAESLRKHDERTQCMIKQAINNILFEQEMKKYNSEQYVVISNVTVDENPLILGDQDDK